MPFRSLSFALLILGALPLAGSGQEPLAWKLQGPFYVHVESRNQQTLLSVGRETRTGRELQFVLGIRPVDKTTDGNPIVEQRVESIRSVKVGGLEKIEDPLMKRFEGAVVRVGLGPQMEAATIGGLSAIARRMAGDQKISPEVDEAWQRSFEAFFKHWTSEIFVRMLDRPAARGDQWEQLVPIVIDPFGTLRVRKRLVFQGQQEEAGRPLAKVTAVGTMTLEPPKKTPAVLTLFKGVKLGFGSYEQTVFFDTAAGRPVRSDAKLRAELLLEIDSGDENKPAKSQANWEQTIVIHYSNDKPTLK